MSASGNAPVIIKRKKVVAGDGHHGGAWKVAYADFVTAMMAFFMLMWLLNATTEKQRKGIADYFNPTIPVNRISGGGEGAFGGESIFSEQVLAQSGTGASGQRATEARQARGASGVDPSQQPQDAAEQARLAEVEEALSARGGESMAAGDALRHIVTKVTDEGLIVELYDLPGAALFEEGNATPTPLLVELAALVADVFDLVTNDVAVAGHSRAHPRALAHDPAWDLSTERAQSARALLEAAGLDPARIDRVTGHGDRSPAARDPMAVRNNRLQLILLRSDI